MSYSRKPGKKTNQERGLKLGTLNNRLIARPSRYLSPSRGVSVKVNPSLYKIIQRTVDIRR